MPNKGGIIIQVLVFAAIGVFAIGGLVAGAIASSKASTVSNHREQALQIAEAGIDYYRWHLAHDPEDFQDGTGAPGPYVHDFFDKDDIKIGEFSLDIVPPSIGSTLVVIRSTGTVLADTRFSRTIEAQMAIPSLAQYAVVANNFMRFGGGTEAFGPLHSNGGIRFDGLAHNLVTSAQEDFNDPDHSGGNEFGVHTHVNPVDPLPPAGVPLRPDVFETGRIFPVPAVDFVGLTTDLAQIKTDAQNDGLYFSDSGALGYHIVLKTDDTFDLYRVTSQFSPHWSCNSGQEDWGVWSVQNETFLSNNPFPNNGLVFVEDNLWVDGQIDVARLTIASAKFPDNPSTRTSIIINNDLLYTNYDGQDVLALMAQRNINIGLVSADNFRIDASLVAQNGRVGRHYYRGPYFYFIWYRPGCSPYHERDQVTTYGSITTNQRYGFAYTDGTGYDIRELIYDANLLYGPPPSFPLTSDQYEVISWNEI